MKSITPIAVLALTLLAPAGAFAQNREHQQMAAELRILQEQNQLLSLALQKALAQLDEAVKTINARLDESDQAARKAMADQKLQIDHLTSEVRVIRERTQDASTRIGTLTEEVKAVQQSLATLSAPEVPAALDPFTGLPIEVPGPGGGSAPPARSSLGISPSRLYQEAWGDYTVGLFELAIDGFETYLREFPNSEQADEAQLRIGDSYMQLKKYPDAISAYMAVIQNFQNDPNREAVPEAYLSLGQAQRAIGQTEAARSSWETLMRLYKDSNSATIASQRLESLQPSAGQPSRQP